MKMDDFFAGLDAVFVHDFPSANREYLENGFLETLRKAAKESNLKNLIVKDNGEIDLDWISFLWWVFKKDSARINDALHGFIWSPEGDGKDLNPESSLTWLIEADPIAKAERIKIKDYIKHINWIYHKIQDLPNIVIIGSDNIPERLHKLRNSKITLLDPKISIPKEKLFPDLIQRRRFHAVDSYDVFDVLNTTESHLIGTQNVVIIDNWQTAFNSYELEQKILLASSLLTEHGRCLFDLPMYGDAVQSSQLFSVANKFIDEPYRHISSNATALDSYVHEIVAHVRENLVDTSGSWRFEIEDLKLTDVGLSRTVAMRVYLKKTYLH